ncbi:MAG: peptidase M23 [Bacteroidetes bacterium]|nr:MAG: peptidase M23 [Bacteroidota bacterium]
MRMISRIKALCPYFCTGVLNSYGQVFFSNNKLFALILLGVSFFDVTAGIAGLAAVLISNLIAYLIGFNTHNIKAGYYGFNSLLVGLGIGIYYQPSVEFYVLLLFISVLTLFITITMEGVVGKYGLPFLSISFLASIWIVTLAARQFTALTVSEKGIFMMNELFNMGEMTAVQTYTWLNELQIPWSVKLYFRSLGAIFFQYHLLAGILVAIGLLIYSRIAFTLTLIGYFSAYAYYLFIGANVYELSAGYIGFNFILTSIAIGGFFLVPSKYSYLWVILLTPLVSLLITSTNTLFSLFQLSVFSLPFNIIVLVFLYILKFRERFFRKPELILYQHYSPEKNLYAQKNSIGRFGEIPWFPIFLPFFGTWKVTQGEDGEHTHQTDWKHAWDYEILSDEETTYTGEGTVRQEYLAYNKPVLAPADGVVVEAINTVDDNDVGSVNLDDNWGNSVVIHHGYQLYSQVSHLKQDSITVKSGDTVKRGDLIAHCGNSGRSPYPHIHFQIQSTPSVGSKILDYPLGHYMVKGEKGYQLKSFEKPKQDEQVSNIEQQSALEKAFHFIPGQKISYTATRADGNVETLTWQVLTDPLNYTYIYCEKSNSRAYFRYDGFIHYFTHFEGKKSSLLFALFLGGWKVVTGFYKGLEVTDTYPLHLMNNPWIIFLQDFIAPFYTFLKADYSLVYTRFEDDLTDALIEMDATTTLRIGRRISRQVKVRFRIGKYGIEQIRINRQEEDTVLTLKPEQK